MFILSLNTGIMVGYALSSIFDYKSVGMIVVGLPIASTILSFLVLSETPQHLLKKNREEDAKNSLKFYRNYKATKENVDDEFEAMKNSMLEARGKSEKITLQDFSEYLVSNCSFIFVCSPLQLKEEP